MTHPETADEMKAHWMDKEMLRPLKPAEQELSVMINAFKRRYGNTGALISEETVELAKQIAAWHDAKCRQSFDLGWAGAARHLTPPPQKQSAQE